MVAKQTIHDFAVFGGTPAFTEILHVGRPNIGNKERFLARMGEALERGWLTNDGPCVEEFERKLQEHVGAAYCQTICNATIGLQLAMRALEMSGEVIVPSFTFIATAHAVQWLGFKPVFCDIDPRTHTIDPVSVEELITPETTGIVGVHLWGQPCDIQGLEAIARRHGLKLLFDAAHAFNCTWQGRMIGNFGDAEVFSFHATKFFNTFEGGALVTNNADLARRVKRMRNFGFAGVMDRTDALGTNGKMSEASAAMGLTNLESLSNFVQVNRTNYYAYREGLVGVPGIRLLTYDEAETRNYQYIVLEIDESETVLSRDEIRNILWAENVLVRRYFYPGCHRMQPYASLANNPGKLPVTDRVARRVLVLPTGTAINVEHVELICGMLRLLVSHGASAAKRLRGTREGTIAAVSTSNP